jgi:hypothetical protein
MIWVSRVCHGPPSTITRPRSGSISVATREVSIDSRVRIRIATARDRLVQLAPRNTLDERDLNSQMLMLRDANTPSTGYGRSRSRSRSRRRRRDREPAPEQETDAEPSNEQPTPQG